MIFIIVVFYFFIIHSPLLNSKSEERRIANIFILIKDKSGWVELNKAPKSLGKIEYKKNNICNKFHRIHEIFYSQTKAHFN